MTENEQELVDWILKRTYEHYIFPTERSDKKDDKLRKELMEKIRKHTNQN